MISFNLETSDESEKQVLCPFVITIGDVMALTIMQIKNFARESKGKAHRTQGKRSDEAKFADLLLLFFVTRFQGVLSLVSLVGSMAPLTTSSLQCENREFLLRLKTQDFFA